MDDKAAEAESLLVQRIKGLMAESQLSTHKASQRIFDSPDTLRAILTGRSANPRADTLARIADFFGVSVDYLTGFTDERTPTNPILAPRNASAAQIAGRDEVPAGGNAAGIAGNSAGFPVDLGQKQRQMPMDLPIMGTAAASHIEGAFQFEGGVISYARRPPALMTERDAYSLYIVGDSMVPRYYQGDLVFVSAHRPHRVNDDVIVQEVVNDAGDISATIGTFVRSRETEIVIGKLNPPAEVSIPRRRLKAIHKVLTMNDIFGI